MGLIEHDKKVFIVHNLDNIKADSARGEGEYLSAYASLLGCDKIGSQKFKKALQTSFTKIYGDKVEHPPKKVYEQIEKLISSEFTLKRSCYFKT